MVVVHLPPAERGEVRSPDGLDPCNLNSAMADVRRWSDSQGQAITCGYEGDGYWAAIVGSIGQPRHDHDDLAEALFSAGLTASR